MKRLGDYAGQLLKFLLRLSGTSGPLGGGGDGSMRGKPKVKAILLDEAGFWAELTNALQIALTN